TGGRQRFGFFPAGALPQHVAGADRLLLSRCGDGEEAAVTNDGDGAGEAAHARFIELDELGARGRWPHHAAEYHARQPHVLHVRGAAGELLWNVTAADARADDAMLARGLGLDLRGGFAVEMRIGRQLPVGGPRAARRGDRSVADG